MPASHVMTMRLAWLVLMLLLFAAEARSAGPDLSALEQAGQRLFLQGDSPTGARLTASVGMGGLTLSGPAISCGNCHGEDGRGRVEAGVVPPDIRWSELVKPYGHAHDSGRRHGPFDEQALRRAVLEGLDPAGNRLGPAMPRYVMSPRDVAALVAYLKQLEHQLDPGVSDQVVRIGTLLPAGGRQRELADSLRDLWAGYFDQLNRRGGLHGRRLELVVETLPSDVEQAGVQVERWLAGADVLALLAPMSGGIEQSLSRAAQARHIPVIGPLTLYPEDATESNPWVFHLLPGVVDLARVLWHQLGTEPKASVPASLALWAPATPQGQATTQAVAAQIEQAGGPAPLTASFPPRGSSHADLAANWARQGVRAVLLLGNGADLGALAAAAAPLAWMPQLLVPGPYASRELLTLPAALRAGVRLAYPNTPASGRPDVISELSGLLEHRPSTAGSTARPGAGPAVVPVEAGHRARSLSPSLVAAYASGLLLVEALERSGHELSRRKLVSTLEQVQNFETGLLPPLSYNADRRIGSTGAYLLGVAPDGQGLQPLGGYVSP